ncbi:hypothetical protein ACOSQ4_027202 [Xanthoceras sorbifolium]
MFTADHNDCQTPPAFLHFCNDFKYIPSSSSIDIELRLTQEIEVRGDTVDKDIHVDDVGHQTTEVYDPLTGRDVDAFWGTSVAPPCTEEREEPPPHSTSAIVVYEPEPVVKAEVIEVGLSRHSSYKGQLAMIDTLKMEEAPIPGKDLPIILIRPFMRTARTIIDIYEVTLTMSINDETTKFIVFDTIKFPNGEGACLSMDILDEVVHENFDTSQGTTTLEKVLIYSLMEAQTEYAATYGRDQQLVHTSRAETEENNRGVHDLVHNLQVARTSRTTLCPLMKDDDELQEAVKLIEAAPQIKSKYFSSYKVFTLSTNEFVSSIVKAP